jgi:hypothetical protein
LLVSYPLHPAIPIPFSQESATKIEHRPRKKSSSAPREAPPVPALPVRRTSASRRPPESRVREIQTCFCGRLLDSGRFS